MLVLVFQVERSQSIHIFCAGLLQISAEFRIIALLSRKTYNVYKESTRMKTAPEAITKMAKSGGAQVTKILHAVFDGKVLKPEESAGLEVGKRYVLTIEPKQKIADVKGGPAFDLSSLAVKTTISDLATEHDHYLYGTSKRRSDVEQSDPTDLSF